MEHQGLVRLQQQIEEVRKVCGVVAHKAAVGLLHDGHSVFHAQLPASIEHAHGFLHHGGLYAQRVHLQVGPGVAVGSAFLHTAKVGGAVYTQLLQLLHAFWRQTGQMV